MSKNVTKLRGKNSRKLAQRGQKYRESLVKSLSNIVIRRAAPGWRGREAGGLEATAVIVVVDLAGAPMHRCSACRLRKRSARFQQFLAQMFLEDWIVI